MTEIRPRPYYRLFQKIALGVGVVVAIAGFALQYPLVIVAGIVIFVHGLTATLILAVEDRRTPSDKNK